MTGIYDLMKIIELTNSLPLTDKYQNIIRYSIWSSMVLINLIKIMSFNTNNLMRESCVLNIGFNLTSSSHKN